MSSIFIRAKRSYESYEDAFAADYNYDYYYLVIESKDISVISNFNDYLVSSDEYKLQFYSSNTEGLQDGKLVSYYQMVNEVSTDEDYYLDKAYQVPTTVTFASHPYPALIEKEDAYIPVVKPLDITLKAVLMETFVDDEGYKLDVKPLDIVKKEVVIEQKKYDIEGYKLVVKPLDITLFTEE